MNRQEANEIGKIMIKSYEKRGGGHHQKLALKILSSIAEGKCEHEEQNVINSDCVVCRMKVAEKGLEVCREKRLKLERIAERVSAERHSN